MKIISAKVKEYNGMPTLYLNNSPATGNLFFLNGDTLDFSAEIYAHELKLTSACGFHGYTTNINVEYGAAPGLNSRHRQILDTIINADPEAVILLRVNTTQVLSPDSEEDQAIVLDGNRQNLASIASERWANETEIQLRAIAAQIGADERYAAHVIGYHLEWLEWMQPQFYMFVDTGIANTERYREYIRKRYADEQQLKEAWQGDYSFDTVSVPEDIPMDDASHSMLIKKGDRRFVDYLEYMGELTAGCIERFAKALKEETDGESLVISFYGYYFEIYHASAGHFAMRKLLNSPWLDGFASPDTYVDRNAGKDARISCGGYMTAVDTVVRSGKLWISESDQRTFINRLPNEQDIISYPPLPDVASICEIHRRAVGMAMVHGTSLYPMELTGCGWYDDIEIWKNFAALDRDAAAYREMFSGKPRFDVALVVDERANARTGCSRMSAQSFSAMMHNFYRLGVKFALLELQDVLNGKAEDISFFVFADPFCLSTEECEILCGRLHRRGTTAVFLNNFGTTALDDVKKLTGMSFEKEEVFSDRSLKAQADGFFDEESFEMEPRMIPSGMTETLGRYSDGAVGFAGYSKDCWSSVFCGTPAIGVKNLQKLMRDAGIEVLSNGNDIVIANDRLIVFLSTRETQKELCFNCPTDVYDDRTGKFIAKCERYTFKPIRLGEVRWLFIGKSADIWRNYRNKHY